MILINTEGFELINGLKRAKSSKLNTMIIDLTKLELIKLVLKIQSSLKDIKIKNEKDMSFLSEMKIMSYKTLVGFISAILATVNQLLTLIKKIKQIINKD